MPGFNITEEFRGITLSEIRNLISTIQGEINTAGSTFKEKFGSDPNVEGYTNLYMVQPLARTTGAVPTPNLFHNLFEAARDWAGSSASVRSASEELYCDGTTFDVAQEFEGKIIGEFEDLDTSFLEVIEKYNHAAINQDTIDPKVHKACTEIVNTMVARIEATIKAVGEKLQAEMNDNLAVEKVFILINNFIYPCAASFFKLAFGLSVEEKEEKARLESMFDSREDRVAAGISNLNSGGGTMLN